MAKNPDFDIREFDPVSREVEPAVRELDHRVNDGIDVTLLWNKRAKEISVAVQDEKTGESFELDVSPDDALTAFHHPYSYTRRVWADPALAA